ncbi:MAG: hypothetical protein PUP92_19290 [Rhizonema sp. PD38]|nr:hypothetical protein [Rhizonema sp. PD38]
MASIFFQQDLDQKLATILCERLSVRHQQNCLAAAEVVSPSRAKQFWQALKASAKIYTILVGNIRLLDTADNLVTTLKSVSVFRVVTLCMCCRFLTLIRYICAGDAVTAVFTHFALFVRVTLQLERPLLVTRASPKGYVVQGSV